VHNPRALFCGKKNLFISHENGGCIIEGLSLSGTVVDNY